MSETKVRDRDYNNNNIDNDNGDNNINNCENIVSLARSIKPFLDEEDI